MRGSGEIRLTIDREEVLLHPHADDWDDPAAALLMSRDDSAKSVILGPGRHLVEVTAGFNVGPFLFVEVCARRRLPPDGIARAVRAAAEADVAILLVGNTEEHETETKDRTNLSLPGDQALLVESVTTANPRTVVVVHAGMPVDLECAKSASALLYGWFAGQEVGPALSDVLMGEREPSGRLPFTIGRRLEDYPVRSTAPDAVDQLHYDESIFVGYRHFDAQSIEPAFAFGHGLGYSTFVYGDLEVEESRRGETVHASVVVTNVGPRRAEEVVQLYVSKLAARVPRPEQELAALRVVYLSRANRERCGSSWRQEPSAHGTSASTRGSSGKAHSAPPSAGRAVTFGLASNSSGWAKLLPTGSQTPPAYENRPTGHQGDAFRPFRPLRLLPAPYRCRGRPQYAVRNVYGFDFSSSPFGASVGDV